MKNLSCRALLKSVPYFFQIYSYIDSRWGTFWISKYISILFIWDNRKCRTTSFCITDLSFQSFHHAVTWNNSQQMMMVMRNVDGKKERVENIKAWYNISHCYYFIVSGLNMLLLPEDDSWVCLSVSERSLSTRHAYNIRRAQSICYKLIRTRCKKIPVTAQHMTKVKTRSIHWKSPIHVG